jgi:hypothetical protein
MAKRFSRVNYHQRLLGAFAPAIVRAIVMAFAMFIAVTSPRHASATSRASLSPDGIFKKYKGAVVRIEITLHGASLGVGSGYFISKSGEIVTSLHVVRPVLVHPESEIKIKTALGNVLRNVKLGACSDARGIDLCLLKVDHASSSFLPPIDVDVTPGESIVAIGHPRGLDYSISTGIVSAVREHPAGWKEVQIDAAISPGNSGGPIINKAGQSIGVVYQFERDGQNLNFGILTPEIRSLSQSKHPYLKLSDARRAYLDRGRRLSKRVVEKLIRPAIASLAVGTQDPKSRPTGFKWMKAVLASKTFLMLVPEVIQNCEKSDESDTVSSTTCSSNAGDLIVTIQKRPRSLEGSIVAYRGRKLVEARPLAIVERLDSEGQWEKLKSKETSFISRPSASRCHPIQKRQIVASDENSNIQIRKKGFFQDAAAVCRFETENDSEPGAVSVSQWIEHGSDFYGINVWTAEPGKLAFAVGLSDLILVSAGLTADDAADPYRLKLRSGLNRIDPNSRPRQVAGADLYDVYQDETSTITIARTVRTVPSQMNRGFTEWAQAIAKSSGMKISAIPGASGNSIESAVVHSEIAGRNGRIGNWVMTHTIDKSKSALLMMATSFAENETWIIFEIQPLQVHSQKRSIAATQAEQRDLVSGMERFRNWIQNFEPIQISPTAER